MLKIIEYANISHDVYGANFEIPTLKKGSDKKYGIYRINEIDRSMHPNNPCFAALYVKFQNRKATDAVIAIRGTQSFTDAKVDFTAWKSDVLTSGRFDAIPTYYPHVFSFYRLALAYVQQHFGLSKVTFTGHSLGGALAQLLVGLGKQPFTAITFNSPGVGHIPGVSADMGAWVHGINSRYGFINKIGEPLGDVIDIDVPQQEASAKQVFETYQQMQHTAAAEADSHSTSQRMILNKLFNIESDIVKANFIAAVYPQHSIVNMIGALKHDPSIGQRVIN